MKFTKYIYVLHLLSTIPAPTANYPNDSMTQEEAIAAWDHLFEYILAHWPKPLTSRREITYLTESDKVEVDECREMLCMNADELRKKLETLPPEFGEMLFPVVIARYLLRELRIPLDHRRTKTFSEFHFRYGTMILY